MAASTDKPRRRGRKALIALATFLVLVVLVIVFWNWDWFIPLVDRQAGAAINRKVEMKHLHVRLGRVTTIVADDVAVGGTPQFPRHLAEADHLGLQVELFPLLLHRQLILRLIDLDHPRVDVEADRKGNNNFTLDFGNKSGGNTKPSSGPGPTIGVIRIEDGKVSVNDQAVRAAFAVAVHTANTPDPARWPVDPTEGQIVASAKGTYAGQPIEAQFTGGAILLARSKDHPYPLDLRVENGPTQLQVKGTLLNPTAFTGANIRLALSGPDMSLLLPLTGVPIPRTPAYKVSGDLDYTKQKIVFRNFAGQVGSSDLEGTIGVVPGTVPDVDADLHSKRVDLTDLGGFIGTDAGHKAAPGAKPAVPKGDILPSTPINIPRVKAANVRLSYKGAHIENRSVPLDDIVARMNIQDGVITVPQLDFKVGSGTIFSHAKLDPVGKEVKTAFHVDFHQLDLSRLLAATHAFHGQGTLGGKADVVGTGSSIAGVLGDGNGGITLVLSGGGDISALLHDLIGLELGNAVLSALGIPNKADLRCFIVDMPLKDGILSTNAFLLQSSEARSVGQGSFNLRDQTANFSLTTRSSHF
ncbi:MAG: AsmA family protein, partial [Gluconacetobacter diazotrophicus]|nr:AsmA family protein [Gluconacetobacter diazotrophicus]